jgi:hypothetical protein
MTAPIVNALPTAPTRLSHPSNFVTESALFLEALPAYRTQVNQLSSYVNEKILNKFNLGVLNGIRTFPVLSQTTVTDIPYDNNSLEFTSNIDSIYFVLKDYSDNVTASGIWLDLVIAENGLAPYDLDKPLVQGVTSPMLRTQERTAFNASAASFSETALENLNSMYQSIWYTYTICCGDDDNGLITDNTIISFTDCGSITDSDITY